MDATRPTAGLAVAGLLAWATVAGEAARLEFNLAEVAGPGIVARDITVTGLMGPDRQAGRLRIERLDLGEDMAVTGLAVNCPRMRITLLDIRCESGTLSGDFPLAGAQQASVTWRWNRPRSQIEAAVEGLAIAGGRIRLTADIDNGTGTYRVQGHDLEADALAALVSGFTRMGIGGTISGRLDVDLEARMRGQTVDATVVATAAGLTGSNEAGTVAFENVGLGIRAVRRGSGEIALTVDTGEGQMYAEPVFLDFSAQPASLDARLETGGTHPSLRRAGLDLGAFLAAEVTGKLAWTGQEAAGALDVAFESADAGALYTALLKPFVYATPMDDMEVSGRLSGSARLDGGRLVNGAVDLDGMALADRRNRFAFTDLRGRLTWPGEPRGSGNPSYLAWAGGALYGLSLGPAAAAFSAGPGHVRLLEATRFPVLDGALRLSRLEIYGTGGEDSSAAIEAELEPVSLQRLSAALDWPPFAGELSGTLPLLRYENGEAIVGGTLAASVFDGDITIDNLRLVEPLGDLPRLFADARIRNLDLETLTRAFSFGRITGRLDGDVNGLQMIAWSPAAFDARLYSSPGSKDRRRISQRAVENISSIGGGGAAAALSGTFLRFFDDFAYREIGVRCRLRQGVCQMGGVGPAEPGYYLVQGRGLPRIDVVGYAEKVDWPRLVAQLKSVSLEGDVRVE